MKRKILLGVVASSFLATISMAGTLTGGADINISKEWLSSKAITGNDANVTVDLSNVVYIPTTIPAGTLSNPTLNVRFLNAKSIQLNNSVNLGICEMGTDQNLSVLTYDHTDTANNALVFKAINAANTMGNSKKYYFCNTDTNKSITLTDANVTYNLNPSADTYDMVFDLYSGDSQVLNDTANGGVKINKFQQICAAVVSPFSKKIDPATGFTAFAQSTTTSTGCTTTTTVNNDTNDSLIVTWYDDKSQLSDVRYGLNTYKVYEKLTANTADGSILPVKDASYITDSNFINFTSSGVVTIDGNTFTLVADGINNSSIAKKEGNLTLNLQVDGTTPLKETTFTVDLGIDLNNNGLLDSDIEKNNYLKTNISAGDWKFKGTLATIPYAVYNGDTQTAVRLTNGQNVNAYVYWTCTDDNGVTVANLQVNSADQHSEFVPANGAAAWLMSDVLKAAQQINPDFAPNGKMKCNVLVTATSGVSAVTIMTISGGRDRVIPTDTTIQE